MSEHVLKEKIYNLVSKNKEKIILKQDDFITDFSHDRFVLVVGKFSEKIKIEVEDFYNDYKVRIYKPFQSWRFNNKWSRIHNFNIICENDNDKLNVLFKEIFNSLKGKTLQQIALEHERKIKESIDLIETVEQ